MATWPNTLPQKPLYSGYAEDWEKVVLRTEMDAGPAKTRKRFTAGVKNYKWSFAMTEAQVETLYTFYTGSANYGATAFDFPHPRTNSTISIRMVEPPSLSPMGVDSYKVDLVIEQLP